MAHRHLARSPWFEARALKKEGALDVVWHKRLGEMPLAISVDIDIADRAEGMMLGLAIGDSLGNTSESMLPRARRDVLGWIEDSLPNRHAGGNAVGLPTDDTQMAFWTLEHLLAEGRLEPHYLASAFTRRRIFGIGKSVREFVANFKSGVEWTYAGAESAGNGAIMRIAPMLLPYLAKPSDDLWSYSLLAANLTHRDAMSNAACVAFVDLLWKLVSKTGTPEGRWWIDTFAATCADLETEREYVPRGGKPAGFRGTLSKMLHTHVLPALEANLPVLEACERWHSGAYLLETVPSFLYILARHGHDPKAAILEAVNHTKDNDTIAAIVGAAVGALHGRRNLPSSWIDNLLGRTTAVDDGRVFELLARAGSAFGYGVSDAVLARVPPGALARPLLIWSPSDSPPPVQFPIDKRTCWIKITGMLQQNWAVINDLPNTDRVRIWFFDDDADIFDCMELSNRDTARVALARNGFSVYTSERFSFIAKPGPIAHWNGEAARPIYSSGRYWIG